ncbi:MAG: hypothetical protein J6V35_08085 [Bacteroidales bacterium]|nr:hypothetical protein [Bacteroidales bacterium]
MFFCLYPCYQGIRKNIDVDDLFEINEELIKEKLTPNFQGKRNIQMNYQNIYNSPKLGGMKVGGL